MDQVIKTNRKGGTFKDMISNSRYICTNAKVRVYKTCVRPIMTHAAKTKADNNQKKRQQKWKFYGSSQDTD